MSNLIVISVGKNGIANARIKCDMTDPFVERDKEGEPPPTPPLEKYPKADELAVELAEEWTAPETPGDSSAS